MTDPYLDPETGILRNLVGARTRAELAAAEGDLTAARLVQLLDQPVKPTGDLAELQAIHRHLFQDVFDWAGKLRTVDVRKDVPGAQPFMPVSLIGRGAGFAFDELRSDNMLRGMTRGRFIDRLAHHYDQVNHVHPFREGNGRAQRAFWSRVARSAGWQLDWRQVQGPENDEACRRAAEEHNLESLRAMFDRIVSAAAPLSAHDDSWLSAEAARHAFPGSAQGPRPVDDAELTEINREDLRDLDPAELRAFRKEVEKISARLKGLMSGPYPVLRHRDDKRLPALTTTADALMEMLKRATPRAVGERSVNAAVFRESVRTRLAELHHAIDALEPDETPDQDPADPD